MNGKNTSETSKNATYVKQKKKHKMNSMPSLDIIMF